MSQGSPLRMKMELFSRELAIRLAAHPQRDENQAIFRGEKT